MERRSTTEIGIETREDGKRTITGMGAVFYRKDDPGTEYVLFPGVVERIMPTAFDRALSENDDVRGLYNHEPDNLLGRTSNGTMRLAKNRRGLSYEIDPPDTELGKSVTTLIDRGDINGSSFSFHVTDERWGKEDDLEVREIRGVKLYDVGPVTFPAYAATSATARDAEWRSSYDAWKRESRDDESEDPPPECEGCKGKQETIDFLAKQLDKHIQQQQTA